MKTCFKCGIEKPLSEFYRHRMMADGLLGKCKACTKLDVRTHRDSHDSVREYDRNRSGLPHRVELRTRVTREWRKRNPEAARAQAEAHKAMKAGYIATVPLCQTCGLDKRLEKHHPDYSRPLLVVWLCKRCHAIADKLRRVLEVS